MLEFEGPAGVITVLFMLAYYTVRSGYYNR
jgi:hypothetical protein